MENRKLFNIPLLTILSTFIVTYFVYNDFNVRILYYLSYACLGVLLLLVFISRIKNKQQIFNFSLVEIIYLVIPVVVLISLLRPGIKFEKKTFFYAVTMIIATGFILLSKMKENEENRIFKIILIFTLIIAGCETLYKFFPAISNFAYSISSDVSKEYNDRVIGSYVYAMGASLPYVAYMLVFGIGAAISLSYKNNKKYLNIIAIVFMYFVIILLNRRGEFLAITATLVFTFFILDNPEKRKKHLIIFLISLVVIIALLIVLFPVLKNVSFLSRYTATIEGLLSRKDISSGRLPLYKNAWKAFTEHPIIGVGWNNFQTYTGSRYGEVHNIYLQFMCELGIFGALLLTGSLVTMFVITIINLHKALKLNNDKAIQLLSFSFFVQCFVLLIGMLDPIFTNLIFLLIYAVAVCFTSTAYKILKD